MLHIIKKIYRFIAPYYCCLCLHPAEKRDLCVSCFTYLPRIENPCERCAQPLLSNTKCCAQCKFIPPPFSIMHALFAYETPVTKMIMELKFHQQLINARLLGELMAEAIQNRWYYNKTLPEVIIPIPLHLKRLRERGFNQAIEIARPLQRILRLPIGSNLVSRERFTKAQARLALHKRRHNMRNAFKINKKFPFKFVAVLDDVFTTGETMRAFCQLLLDNGVEKIHVWCIARTVLH